MLKFKRSEAFRRIVAEPDFWRETMRKCESLAWPQRYIRDVLLKAIDDNLVNHEGGIYVVLAARQTTKNESEAELEAQMFYRYPRMTGLYVRTGPTSHQVTTSRDRLRTLMAGCPVARSYGGLRQTAGEFSVVPFSRTRIKFVSTDPKAIVQGATANLALSNDEFHLVDPEHYRSQVQPFFTRGNALVVNWGVAADGLDMLHEDRQYNDERYPKRNLIFPAPVWADIWPSYGKSWDLLLNRYGIDHPMIQTQYMLNPVTGAASLLGRHLDTFLTSEHDRLPAPRENCEYVMLIDIAGEEDIGSDQVVEVLMDTDYGGSLDSTAIAIVEIDHNESTDDLPMCRIVQLKIWVGKKWQHQRGEIVNLIKLWQPTAGCVDAVGVGNQLAKWIRDTFGERFEAYSASAATVNEDLTEFYRYLNLGLLKMFRNDDSDEYKEALRQLTAAQRILRGDKLKVAKRKATDRIDFPKCLTYLPRTIERISESKPFFFRAGGDDD